jgi:hypothetical protein
MPRDARAVVTASVLTVPITLTHASEDLSLGFAETLGLPLLLVAFGLSLAYAAQVLGAALVVRGGWHGYALNAALALIWLAGATLEHLNELLFVWPYRTGLISKGLVALLFVSVVAWGFLSARALLRVRQSEKHIGRSHRT